MTGPGRYHFRYADGEPQADLLQPHGLEGFYANPNHPVAVVARLNPGRDWAAYIGAGEYIDESEELTLSHVARDGAKLSEALARAFFPEITEAYRD